MRVPFYLRVLVGATLAIGAAWWAATAESSWWAGYTDYDGGFAPKLKFGWCEQAVVAVVVGLLAAAPTTLAFYGFNHLFRPRR